MAAIQFRRDLAFEYGKLETVSPLIRRIIARNPGPFTFHGTGTYVVGHGRVAVIDPGPALAAHVDALLDALRGETIEHIVVTHTHLDHSPASAAVKAATGARTYGYGPHGNGRGAHEGPAVEEGGDHNFLPDVTMRDGDVLDGAGWRLTAVHTPGHTSNHLCFALASENGAGENAAGENAFFSGDHVMGWSTSVISPPDGDMTAYMASLEKLLARDEHLYWPTHGPAIPDPRAHVRAFIEHRRARTAAILARMQAGDTRIADMVAAIYVDVPQHLHRAAGRSVLAHLVQLVDAGRVACDGAPTLDADYRLNG